MKGKPHGKVQLDDLMVLSGSRGVNAPRLQNTHHVVAPAKGKSKLLSEKRELPKLATRQHGQRILDARYWILDRE